MGRTGWVTDANLAQRNETTEIPWEDAQRLHRELAGASLPGTNTPIPFHYPPDGCYARAHHGVAPHAEGLRLAEGICCLAEIPPERRRRDERAQRRLPFAADAAPGQGPNVSWWYHVAPIIQVRLPAGTIMEMVIDPSIFANPAPVAAWTASMSPENFQRVPDGGLQSVLAHAGPNAQNGFPVDRPMVFTGDRNAFFPADAVNVNTADHANQQYAQVAARMQYYAQLAQFHQLAAHIRTALAQIPPNHALVLQRIQEAHAAHGANIAFFFGPRTAQHPDGHFPHLLVELRQKMPPEMMAQIDAILHASQEAVAQAAAASNPSTNAAGGGGS
jgi:hypothetical protein